MDINGSRILVTGGLGFIGSHIVEALVAGGAQVRILDNYRTGFEENILSVRDDVEIIRGDILDRNDLMRALSGVDAVSHHAAQLEIMRAIDNPIEDLTTNTIGTLNLFEACVASGVRRIVQATSAGVYGQAVTVPQTETGHPTDPNWAYGVSKLANEKYAAIYRELHGLEITSLRYGIVYGPREWYGRVLTLFLRRALDNESLVIFGDGEQIRDFVYVGDVVNMHNQCLVMDASKHEVFNVATGQKTSINQLANIIKKVTDRDIEIIYDDVPEGSVSQYIDRRRLPQELRTLVQSPEKATKLIGWLPQTALEDGIAKEWNWIRENAERWTVMAY
ncbi:MAG TPA: NAD-dependent epimerase/dehydratase family protein [Acidimicrobiales bacterium]|nr:NAD-dependent epimerase/dehydratase family protein [Acidimicrobiales bacterium]